MFDSYPSFSEYEREDWINLSVLIGVIAVWFLYISFASTVLHSPRAIMWGIALPSVLLGIYVENRKIRSS